VASIGVEHATFSKSMCETIVPLRPSDTIVKWRTWI